MNLILIIFFTIVFIAFVGMFYWMYKAREGTLNLNKNSWHFKLMNYMWKAEISEIKNACPYYWSLVFSVLSFIPYLIVKYFFIFYDYILNLIPKIKVKKEIKPPKIRVKEEKSKYSYIYTKSKDILEWIMIGTFLLILIIGLICGGIDLYKTSLTVFISVFIIIVYLGTTFYLHNKKPELDIYHWNHYKNFFLGLYGIIKIPFIIIGWILSSIFSKITKVYVNNCPAIMWE